MASLKNVLNIMRAVVSTSIVNLQAETVANPNLRVVLYSGATKLITGALSADGITTAVTALETGSLELLFNEATWDRKRGNTNITILASAARIVTTNSADLTNYNHRGVRLFLDITAISGASATLDVKVQTKDSVSSGYFDLPGAAFAQKSTVTSDDLTIYPGIAETANETVSDVLGRTWRIVATIAGTTPSVTFSVGAQMIL